MDKDTEIEDEQSAEQTAEQKSASRPWLYKKGQSGNPSGRPKGRKSLKQWIKERLEKMNDEEREDFMEGMPKEVIWKMGEGNPHNTGDVRVELPPIPIDDVRKDHSLSKDKKS